MKFLIDVDDQEIHDILVTAFDVGCGYWAECRIMAGFKNPQGYSTWSMRAADAVMNGPGVRFADRETGESLGVLDANAISRGVQGAPWVLNDHDAAGADVFVQYALFGKVVFG